MKNSVTPYGLCDPLARRFFAVFLFLRNVGVCRVFGFCVFRLSVTPQMGSVTPLGGHAADQGGQGFEPSVTCDPLSIKLGRLIYSWGVYILVHKCFRDRGGTGHPESPQTLLRLVDIRVSQKYFKKYINRPPSRSIDHGRGPHLRGAPAIPPLLDNYLHTNTPIHHP